LNYLIFHLKYIIVQIFLTRGYSIPLHPSNFFKLAFSSIRVIKPDQSANRIYSIQDIEAILSYLHDFEKAGFDIGEMVGEDGKFPWADYSGEVMEFYQDLHRPLYC
jgi:hypothetical protein